MAAQGGLLASRGDATLHDKVMIGSISLAAPALSCLEAFLGGDHSITCPPAQVLRVYLALSLHHSHSAVSLYI